MKEEGTPAVLSVSIEPYTRLVSRSVSDGRAVTLQGLPLMAIELERWDEGIG